MFFSEKIPQLLSRWAHHQLEHSRSVLSRIIVATLGFAGSVFLLLLVDRLVLPSLKQELYSLGLLATAIAFGLWALYGYLCLCFGRIIAILLPEESDAD